MIESIYSILMFVFLLFGLLLLDETFLAMQTVETAHFFALRSHIVGMDIKNSETFFNHHVLKNFIFDEQNNFFEIQKIKTHQSKQLIETSITLRLKESTEKLTYSSQLPGLQQP